MIKERLLKRIRGWSANPDLGFGDPDLGTYTQSIINDLSNIYNTRQGTVLLDNKFGIPDFTSLMSNMSLPEIEKLTRSFIDVTQTYEPRLKNLSVRYEQREEDRGLIRFVVNSKVKVQDGLSSLDFNILLQGDGSVVVQIPE
jgi:type VI secretion system lysozyme-like protein